MTNVAVLDDWRDVARTGADWTALQSFAEALFFQAVFVDEDDAMSRLAGLDVVMAMRERTAFPASLVQRLPRPTNPAVSFASRDHSTPSNQSADLMELRPP